ncbi:hypothetical protein JWV37_10360 [Sulfurospirillum sp. T05]|uniref:Uncharacterized protein n=1 Tax=Sulfurospirillum tamanense TaxID=2813362 RepID=A0ABS2WVF4_9BACT|nr:hypothetical protein [Sulfurospirillum tamanensis]MBN2965184.1 hypothetical protein [Sulfurospirillum tamanensis]
MEVIKSGFEVSYNLGRDYIVKSTGAGAMEGRKFGSSVKVSTYNLYEKPNEKTEVMDEVMEEVIFKIPCDSDAEAGALLDHFKQCRKTGQAISFSGSLPNQRGEVSVLNTVREIMGLSKIPEKPTEKPKA